MRGKFLRSFALAPRGPNVPEYEHRLSCWRYLSGQLSVPAPVGLFQEPERGRALPEPVEVRLAHNLHGLLEGELVGKLPPILQQFAGERGYEVHLARRHQRKSGGFVGLIIQEE